MTTPIQIKSKLAGNPQQSPLFAVEGRTSQGPLKFADPRAIRALVSLMDMNAVLGGAACHYGGPAALAELNSAMHAIVFDEAQRSQKNWYELFNLVNDAGHCENGLYALKAMYGFADLNLESLKKFRSIDSGLTGHGEVHCFPEGVQVSNGPLGSAVPQSQGLAMGDKLAKKERVTITVVSDGAAMEGEAKEAFAAIPGLAKSGHLASYVLVITDNNTKLSGRIDKDAFSMQPTFEALQILGWKVIKLENGNDLSACVKAFEEAIALAKQNPQQPVAIHAKTIKGIGTKKTAESSSGGHGFPLKSPSELPAFLSEIYGGEAYPSVFDAWISELNQLEAEIKAKGIKDSGEKIQKGVAAAMIKARKEGLPVVSVTSDLPGSTGVADFRKEFPEASLDVGVAESNMISSAAGMSKVGFIPVVDTFAQFGVTKGALPFIMASLSEAPVVAMFSHTGFQDAADGASHQALSYVAMMASIPHVEVVCLSCSEEAEALVYQTLKRFAELRQKGEVPPSTVFFLGRENFPKAYVANANYCLGSSVLLANSTAGTKKQVTLLTSGSLVPQILEAQKILLDQGVGALCVHTHSVNNLDVEQLKTWVESTQGQLVVAEDHQKIGGIGQMVIHALAEAGVSLKAKSLGVRGEFGQSAYTALDLYSKHGLDAKSIAHAAMNL